jgi:chemotaxis protein MotB
MARKQQEDCPKCEEWVLTFGDMMSLLCVFFIMLYAMANTDLQNFEKVAAALREAFLGQGQTIIGESGNSGSSAISAPVFPQDAPLKQQHYAQMNSKLAALAQQMGLGGQISVNMSIEGIIISLSDSLVFEPGSTELRSEAKVVLDEVIEVLGPIDNGIRVEGHTDNIPTNNPTYPTNWELSTLRAVAVVRYLAEEGGINPIRLAAAGNAEFKPLVPNTSRANRALNRRADIVVVYPGEANRYSITLPEPSGSSGGGQ